MPEIANTHDSQCERGYRVITERWGCGFEPHVYFNPDCHCHYRARQLAPAQSAPPLDTLGRCCGCRKHPRKDDAGFLRCRRCKVTWDTFGNSSWRDWYGGFAGTPVITPELTGDRL